MNSIKKKRISYLLTITILAILFVLFKDVPWIGSTNTHTIMESIATTLAIMIGISALVRFHAKRDEVLFLFIGAGFLGTGFLDGYHAVVTAEFFQYVYPSPPESLIPWSWIASRLYLSIFFFIAYFTSRKNKYTSGHINSYRVYWVTFLSTATSFFFFAFVPLPAAYYPDLILHRPEELLPAFFFGLALYGFYKRGEWKRNAFEYWLILSLIVNLTSQIMFMSFSDHLFDFEFDIAHLLKKISYIIVLIGVYVSMLDSFKREVLLTNNLNTQVNEQTKDLENSKDELCKLNISLESKIKQEIEKNILQERKISEQSKLVSMGEMIGNIAHQWRQPLSVISTGITGMKVQKEFGLLEDDNFYKTCDTINENTQYLSKTIDDFRNFINGNRIKKIFNVSNNINSGLHLLEGTIKKNDISIVLNLNDDIKINGYENELTQCLLNIFNNAKDALLHIEEEKYIFISSSLKDNYVIISFKDNAGGIPNNVLPKIFEPYYTTKHKSQGTGLGLHMTYNLITSGMQGTIEAKNITYVYDEKEYTGAVFTITLPLK